MRRKTRVSVIVVTLMAGLLWKPLTEVGRGFSQTDDKGAVQLALTDQIDAYIAREMQARRIPGVAIAVPDISCSA